MHLSKVNEALNHRITGGSEYQWNCYGFNVRFLDYESVYATATVVFDTLDQTVYEATVNSKDDSVRPYRWFNPNTKQDYLNECKARGVDSTIAWDNVKWVDLETMEDFLDKASAILEGEDFDERVQVPIDLDRDELFQLMQMAHERDITLNEMVEEILWNVINAEKNKVHSD